MATIGPLYPGTAQSVATAPYNGIDWVATSIVNIRADDTSYGSIIAPTYDTGVISNLLVGRNFGATVPADGTIDGLLVEIGKWYSAGSARDAIVTAWDGSIVGSNLGSTGIAWPSSIATISYGGSTNKWGLTPTPAQVNGTNFGFGLSAVASADNTDVWVDFIRLTIYYTASSYTNITAAEDAQAQISDVSALGVWTPVTPSQQAQAQISDLLTLGVQYPLTTGDNYQAQVSDAATATFSGTGPAYNPTTGTLDAFNRVPSASLGTSWAGPFAAGNGGWQTAGSAALPYPPVYYPLGTSTGGRYLVDRRGTPFLLISDSPQSMLTELTTAQMDDYLSTRSAQGFNASQIHIIVGTTYNGGPNGETYDNIAPFTTPGSIDTPNETYFARLDTLVGLAASHNMNLILNAAEWSDWNSMWKTNGTAKCYAWGQYLGNRYQGSANIVWMVGNDFQTWRTDAAGVAALCNVTDGIKSADSNHIYTAWLDYYVSASRDSADFNSRTDLDFGYSYYIMYDKIATEYALSPAKPVFLGESYYEEYTSLALLGVPYILRRQNYWAMLAGACGITYQNVHWAFTATWDTDLTGLPGVADIAHFKSLFEAYPWWNLVPDTTNQVLTAGYGTKRTGAVQPDAADPYCNCAWITDGSLAMIYMPTNHTLTVDMSKFSGTVTCRWYDPTNGSYMADAASPHANTGTHDFSRATTNSAGDADWVLVLEV